MLREILSSAGIVLVIIFLIIEIRGWAAGTKIVTHKQKGLRISSAVLLLIILAMFLVGDKWAMGQPFLVLIYWMTCFVLAVTIVILTLLDIREVGRTFSDSQRNMVIGLIDPEDDANQDSK
ncbi:MAG: hypothetical protein ACYC27_13005 [Armatimonadota bacterium]